MKRPFTLLLLLAMLAAACVNDPIEDPVIPPNEDTGTRELLLNVVVPGNSSGGAATRSITATEENTIQTVNVLAFKIDGANETYDYAVTATLAPNNTPGAATQTFVANLRTVSYGQRFVVITNASSLVGAQISGISQGTAKATVLANLRYDLASNQDRWTANSSSNFTPIPMWGESGAETITTSTRNLASTIYLMRMLARLDVRLDTSVTGLTDQFKMKSVALYNTNTGGRMVPDASKVVSEQRDGQPYARVNATTVPTSLQPYSARRLGPISYTDFTAPGTTDVAMIGAIYTFEADAVTSPDAQATCIVVGGLYGTDTTPTYYRVELYAAGTQNRLALLRNHQYIVNITGVNGRGYATAAEAFNSPPVNMTAQVLQWNHPGIDNIAFNGQTHLATDKAQINLFANEYTNALTTGDNVIQAITDVPAGWTLGPITNGDGTGTASWVRISPTQGAGGDATTRITVSVDANSTGSSRTAIVNLVAGRLRLPVRIVQSNQPAISLNIVDRNNNEIQELVFSSPGGIAPTTQSFWVNWLPASNPVSVAATQVGQWEFPNPGGNPASNDGAPYQNMPWTNTTGSRQFDVSPPAIAASDLAANPFLKKSSRFDMTINNGYTTMTKSITLTQLYYQLMVEPNPFTSPYFPMDGNRYAYNVRSNTTFRISNIVETPRVSGTKLIADHTGLDNVYVGATGGPVSTPGGGWREYLTTNGSAKGMSGYADVTYASDKNPALFSPVTRRLFFPAAQFNIFSICLMNSNSPDARSFSYWSGSGPNQPPATDHDVHSMTNGAANFGTNTTGSGTSDTFSSKVPVRGIGTYGLWVGGGSSGSSDGNTYSGTTLTVAMVNAAVTAGADMLVISGDTIIPWSSDGNNPVAQAIYDNFLAKNKPVLLFTNNHTSVFGMFVAALNAGKVSGGMSGSSNLNGQAALYTYNDIPGDPVLVGPFIPTNPSNPNPPFTDMRNRRFGCDANSTGSTGNPGWWFENSNNSNVIIYSNLTNVRSTQSAVDQSNVRPNGTAPTLANGASSFRLTNVPLFVSASGGWLASENVSGNTTGYPVQVNATTKIPEARSWGDFYCYNSYMLGNLVAWAIQRRTTQ